MFSICEGQVILRCNKMIQVPSYDVERFSPYSCSVLDLENKKIIFGPLNAHVSYYKYTSMI